MAYKASYELLKHALLMTNDKNNKG